jgi:hypothetical protein
MSDGAGTREAFQDVHVENIGDQPHPLVLVNDTRFGNGDPGTFLTPVLQGIEPEVTHFGCIRVAERCQKDRRPRGVCRHRWVPGVLFQMVS